MGWGDLAKAAMDEALKAYQASIRVEQAIQGLIEQFKTFREDQVSRRQEFEHRFTEQQGQYERRNADQHVELERRIRELESRQAKLEGRVEAVVGEANAVMLREHVERIKQEVREGSLRDVRVTGPIDGAQRRIVVTNECPTEDVPPRLPATVDPDKGS